jgi:glutamate 5-kinase
MAKFDFLLVGKIGSMALINKRENEIDYDVFAKIGKELIPGYIFITSGAVEIGRLDYIKRNGAELPASAAAQRENNKKDYAAQGQAILMQQYRRFTPDKYSIRQILLEHQHFNIEKKRENLKALLLRCPAQNAIPIINYNDVMNDDELRKMEIMSLGDKEKAVEFVDNDETASRIACLVKTKTLLILTNTDGIYKNPLDASTLIKEIGGKNIEEVLLNITDNQNNCIGGSRAGAGGARAKLEYIKEPIKNGATVIIANAKYGIKNALSGSARTVIGVR